MPAIYRAHNNGKLLDGDNVYDVTGYSLRKLYGCMGLDAIEEDKQLLRLSGIYPQLRVGVKIEDYDCEMWRVFQFDDSTIFNESFNIKRAEYKGRRIGTRAFCTQVIAARNAGFEKLVVWAVGNERMRHTWNGYITWGKLGYTMDAEYQAKFENLMSDIGYGYSSLFELLMAEEEIWVAYGDAWIGEFDLRDNSQNSLNLSSYLDSRKLDRLGNYKV